MSKNKRRIVYLLFVVLCILALLNFSKACLLLNEYTKYGLHSPVGSHQIAINVRGGEVFITPLEYRELRKYNIFAVISLASSLLLKLIMFVVGYFKPGYFSNLWFESEIKKK